VSRAGTPALLDCTGLQSEIGSNATERLLVLVPDGPAR
jgi:hypothetical protein